MGDRVIDSGVCVPDLREEQSMPVSRNKRVDVEGHVVNQIGIGMSEPFLVPRKDKLMEIVTELVNEPLMFTLNAAWRTDWSSQENHMAEPVQF